jgi:hypothetical protein
MQASACFRKLAEPWKATPSPADQNWSMSFS